MSSLNGLYASGDWKGEKHVPVIHAPETITKGSLVDIKVLVGEEIPHPNTFEHYIAWIKVYFLPEKGKFPIELGTYNFSAHGESDLLAEPVISTSFKANLSGTIIATSYCNIHGLWENSSSLIVID